MGPFQILIFIVWALSTLALIALACAVSAAALLRTASRRR